MFTPSKHKLLTDDQAKRLDDACVCNFQLLLLLEHLDPNLWAVQASPTGIAIYPRYQVHKVTTWERTLATAPLPIPSAWIGYLQDSGLQTHEKWTKYLATSSNSRNSSQMEQNSNREEAVDFSLNQLLRLMQEYLSVGPHMAVKSMKVVSRLISKEISGN